mgnify:CR=1 FL=1
MAGASSCARSSVRPAAAPRRLLADDPVREQVRLEQAVVARAMGWEVPEGKSGMAGFGSLDLTLDTLDAWLSANDYVCGSRFTMADTYVGSQFVWGLRFGSIPERPSFKAYVERITQRPAYAEANAIDAAIIKSAKG